MKMRNLPILAVLLSSTQILFGVAIQLSKNRDMQFASSSPSDAAQTINAGDATSTKYTVTGNAGDTFDITFPSGTINMIDGANTIATNTWTSNLTSPGTLDGTGTAIIYIGATRAALGPAQASGNYTANHSLSVQYSGGVGPTRTVVATHSISVYSGISLTKTADLIFADAYRNDAAAAIVPGASSAAYTVTGQANAVYTVSLPANGTVVMSTGGGGTANKEIHVDTFTSNPSGTGTLSGAGTDTLYVGATRAAILGTQVTASDYQGSFMVTVTYQ